MVKLVQNKWHWPILKKTKIKNCMINIHKNTKKTGIKPILELNSTSFMLNNFVSGKNIKKVTTILKKWPPVGRVGGSGGDF